MAKVGILAELGGFTGGASGVRVLAGFRFCVLGLRIRLAVEKVKTL